MFAGEVFPEWYWGPILFILVFGLPLSAAALVVDLAVRRWVRRLPWAQRAGLWVGVVAVGSLAILGGRAVIDHVRFERAAKAAAQKLDFAPYAAERLPDGRCALHRLAGSSTSFFEGPCRALRTPRGRTVFIGALRNTTEGGEAFALLDGTLVRLQYTQVADRDVLAYFDALRPVAPDDLDFKQG